MTMFRGSKNSLGILVLVHVVFCTNDTKQKPKYQGQLSKRNFPQWFFKFFQSQIENLQWNLVYMKCCALTTSHESIAVPLTVKRMHFRVWIWFSAYTIMWLCAKCRCRFQNKEIVKKQIDCIYWRHSVRNCNFESTSPGGCCCRIGWASFPPAGVDSCWHVRDGAILQLVREMRVTSRKKVEWPLPHCPKGACSLSSLFQHTPASRRESTLI